MSYNRIAIFFEYFGVRALIYSNTLADTNTATKTDLVVNLYHVFLNQRGGCLPLKASRNRRAA